jgi:AcrR family transcriptional regulator
VATDLFFEKGYGHVGVDEIGLAAGLSGPAIYRHFKGKGEILAALFDQAIDGLLSVVGTATDNARLDLDLRVRAHAGYVLTQSKLASVWIREGRSLSRDHRNRLRRRERNYIDQWIKLIQRCYPELSSVVWIGWGAATGRTRPSRSEQRLAGAAGWSSRPAAGCQCWCRAWARAAMFSAVAV